MGTAFRQGAESVELWEILPKPPVKRDITTPWPTWPLKLRTTHAHKEGGTIRWAVMTKEFVGEKERVSRIQASEVHWVPREEGGPLVPQEVRGTDFSVSANLVILAMGFTGPTRDGMLEALELEMDERGTVWADKENSMTSEPGVFVAGDMHLGQSLVVRAIKEGRDAARGIISYLEKGRP
jgi:glutamate synthase (NADPH/NADH) small chain